MSLYTPSGGFTGTPDPLRWADAQANIAAARQAAGGASLDLWPEADFIFVDPLTGDPTLAQSLEAVATVTRGSKSYSSDWSRLNGDPAGSLIEHANNVATWGPSGVAPAPGVENLVSNPRGEGAALPSTPTNWTVEVYGVTLAFVARGVADGWPYVDVEINGTATDTGAIYLSPDIAASAGDKVMASIGLAVVSGSVTGAMTLNVLSPGVAVVNAVSFTPSGIHRRWAVGGVMPASTTAAWPTLSWSAGAVFNTARIRIFAPQLTKTDWVAPVVLPPVGAPGASVKAVESILIPASLGWYNASAGTLVLEASREVVATTSGEVVDAVVGIAGTGGYKGRMLSLNSSGSIVGWARDDAFNAVGGNLTLILAALAFGERFIAVMAWDASGSTLTVNGGAPSSFAASYVVPGTGLSFNNNLGGSYPTTPSGNPIHRVRYFPGRLTPDEIHEISTPYWSA